MALFSRKKKEVLAPVAAPAKKEVRKTAEKTENSVPPSAPAAGRSSPPVPKRPLDYVFLSPRITEKAAGANAAGCYVFNIPASAGKREVRDSIIARYGVVPRMVRTTKVMAKNVLTRGSRKAGVKAGGKKAYVYLKEGAKIELA